jgi:hypothetical protein
LARRPLDPSSSDILRASDDGGSSRKANLHPARIADEPANKGFHATAGVCPVATTHDTTGSVGAGRILAVADRCV